MKELPVDRAGVAIALDFGGTKLAAGLVDLATGAVINGFRKGRRQKGRQASLKLALQMVREGLLENADDARSAPVPGASSRGSRWSASASPSAGTSTSPGDRPTIDACFRLGAVPLADYFARGASAPAFIENDPDAIALGLKHFGPGKEYTSSVRYGEHGHRRHAGGRRRRPAGRAKPRR